MSSVKFARNSILDSIYFSLEEGKIIVIYGKYFLSAIFLSKLKAFT